MEPLKTPLSNSDPSMFSDPMRLSRNSVSASSLEPKSESMTDKSNKKNLVRKRTTYNHSQLQELYAHFQRSPYIDSLQMEQLSRRLGITPIQNIPQMLDLSVMNSTSTQGATQPSVTWQQHSGIYNSLHPAKRDNQSWAFFSRFSQQQKTVEFPNCDFSPRNCSDLFQSSWESLFFSVKLWNGPVPEPLLISNMQQQTDTRIQQVGSFDNFMTTLRTTQGNIQNSWNFDTVINPQP